MTSYIENSADIEEGAVISNGCKVWHLAHVREFAHIGENSVIGRNVYVGPNIKIGANTKIQNNAQIYDPAEIEDGVFIGPGAILTNDVYPRAIGTNGESKIDSDWDSSGVTVKEGASIGARAVILAGVTIGQWALIGAGSVVIRDVPNHALCVGNPSQQIGWVGRAGMRLTKRDEFWICQRTKERYTETDQGLKLVNG
ncbi:MAG: N-acetyltransferase [Acidimicrobiaceae bacterium TMED130]|nr:MAG: N-acetyltransferase [Acidimicrobiaceae bacterium TMED130]|tara:strand:- start:8257 stop:8850 length:594 start_codon:yes stop_codon:yes gene_type:complete